VTQLVEYTAPSSQDRPKDILNQDTEAYHLLMT